jgi:predicted  nucleic acid-binding Zn-ribbon protein
VFLGVRGGGKGILLAQLLLFLSEFMSDAGSPQVLQALIQLSKVDGRIAVLSAELKQLEAERTARAHSLIALTQKREARSKVLADKKSLVAREEKSIKGEREKINDRRRALGTLNNYKLQEAAEREIDYVSKQIGQREDLLLGIMREVEILEKETIDADTAIQGMREELTVFEKSSSESIAERKAELATLQADRAAQATAIGNAQILTLYNRVVAKFPSDPIVDVVNRDSCAGCFMKVGPQVPVQISRGDVVKCPGCGRLLKLPAES